MKSSQPITFDKLSLKIHAQSFSWRQILLRDIESLLNDSARSGEMKLYDFLHCKHSVINYGLPPLGKQFPITTDAMTLAKHIQNILQTFEPRLISKSIQVLPVVEKKSATTLAILFDIYGICTFSENSQAVNLRIALDYSSGTVKVI